MTKKIKAIVFICIFIGSSLMLFVIRSESRFRRAEEAIDIIVEAFQKEQQGQELERQVAFSVKDWPNAVRRFVRAERDNIPILGEPSLTTPTLNIIALTKSGEIFQFLDKRTSMELPNPLGWEGVDNGTWYKVRLLDGKEGWIFGLPAHQPPLAKYFETKQATKPAKRALPPKMSKVDRKPAPMVSGYFLLFLYFMAFFSISISSISYFLDDHKRGKGWLVAGILSFLGLTVLALKNLRPEIQYSLSETKGFAKTTVIFFLMPGLILTLMHREGFVKFCIYLKYFFGGTSPQEIIMERIRRKEYEDKKMEYQTKLKDIENKETEIKGQLSTLTEKTPTIIPKIIEYIPEDTGLWKTYFGEVERRMQEGQIKKTVQATRERVEEGRKLWQELAALHRSKADVKKAWSEFSTVDIEIATREKRIKAEQERVDLEIDVERLKLEAEKAKLEKEKRSEDKKGPSPEERLLQSVRDKLKMTAAAGKAIGEITEDRDKTLKSVDRGKSPELYQKIKNMYDNLIMDVMEAGKK